MKDRVALYTTPIRRFITAFLKGKLDLAEKSKKKRRGYLGREMEQRGIKWFSNKYIGNRSRGKRATILETKAMFLPGKHPT